MRARLSRSLNRNLLVGAAAMLLLFGGVGGWAATTELSSAVIASGVLVVDGSAKRVQHREGGIVTAILVREGQAVESGETIVRMDQTASRANLTSIEKKIQQYRARKARLGAERDSSTNVVMPEELRVGLDAHEAEAAMASERRLFADRRASREGQKDRLHEQVQQLREQIKGLDAQEQAKIKEIGLIEKELVGMRRLFDVGGITMSQINALERNAARLRGERGQLFASMASSRGRIAELELQSLQIDQELRAEVATELRDVENELGQLSEEQIAAQDTVKHAEIKAPIGGIVHLLSIHTVGGVVAPAETLMEIVPKGSLLTVEARISPADIDQVAIGQSTTLRLTAFNRNTTPEFTGRVVRVSADLEADKTTGASFYRVGIAMSEEAMIELTHLGVRLVPGMPVESFIRTADRNVVSYFTKPIRDHMQRVFREE
ncbi:HlyD family type I secretion periplasmic adaptor subunit [Rhizobium sp. BK068]|uniref:HlyD family type I secretion periplasmic adaptor subunit n=1 Tax=unclassified Rhizobium TaxID=2613769 RepID=UPI002478FC37|nr:HlyD family type I secretion periplasmic adaptor subunit [Rhizobium sp. BK068]